MASSDGIPKKHRQSLRHAVKGLFRNPKTQTGAAPAPSSRWEYEAGKPEELPSIHAAVRDHDIATVRRVLQAAPHQISATDDRKYAHDKIT